MSDPSSLAANAGRGASSTRGPWGRLLHARLTAYVAAAGAPSLLTFLVSEIASWPKPYSWQYLGICVAVAIVAGIRPGLVALFIATLAVLWLGVPTPVHPGVEMFVAIDLCLLALLHRWRRAQQQLAEHERSLRQALDEILRDRKRTADALTEADRRKDEFIAILSHELRNPLAPIRYALPLLQREPLGDPASRALDVIDRQTAHLARLVDDLLDVSRITRGQIELRLQCVTLGSILSSAIEAASPAIAAARHTLKVSVPDADIWLRADPARIAQVITNLLNNSAKYTPPGGEIVLAAVREDDAAVIRVRDNGMGIPAEALPTVFDMFRQLKGPDKPQGGLGIGLALAKRLVEMHGGTIAASSAGSGQGAEFTVRLPVAEQEPRSTPLEGAHARG